MSNGSEPTQTPFMLFKEDGGYSTLNIEETLSYILYRAENERKKPGLLRRKGERITLVTPINYHIHVVGVDEDQYIVLDGNKPHRYHIEYKKPVLEIVEERVKKLDPAKHKEFLEELMAINNILEKMVKGKQYIVKKTYDIENVIHDPALLSELRILLSVALPERFEGVDIKPPEITHEKQIRVIKEIIDTTQQLVSSIEELSRMIRSIYEKWREEIHTYYAEILHDKEMERDRIMKEVEEKITQLKQKQNEEVEKIRRSYMEKIKILEEEIRKRDENLEKLNMELQKAKEYGKDTRSIKQRISDERKHRDMLLKEKKKLEERMASQIESIVKRYNELIMAQHNRVEQINKEIDKINREVESIDRRANTLITNIESNIHDIIDDANNLKKKIMQLMIPPPIRGGGDYIITSFLVEYRSDSKSRINLYTPQYIAKTKRIRSKPKPFQSIERYLETLTSIWSDERYRDQLVKNNILLKITPEKIMNNLEALAEQDIVDRKKIGKVVESLRDQIRMLS